MLAPPVETLLPNESITSQITEKVLAKLTQGRYMITFEYSTEKESEHSIRERSTVYSEIFIIAD
ncbi:hypothetical protein A2982_02740 [candidate division WWE3 bacterium RIFCSPLOWO2_01_FULL_39_13]|uniref:Uncharacterized protein n=1 Tax=candidate division WWE3 bacterium RIFCSPLOWO2_01_FULL_39_13 TaxID=1802624 RepID=A0A1F4V2S7_UNCKA|nr:MAG: hypothetical protein A2982_02740 [candidate division WWE3 bacterium RIFCSPLOWO2_01_FULL_39_13]